VNNERYGMTIVNFRYVGYREQPFVFTKEVTQVFYLKDLDLANKKERHVVLQEKKKIVGVEDLVDEEDYNKFDNLAIFLATLLSSSLLPHPPISHNCHSLSTHNPSSFITTPSVIIHHLTLSHGGGSALTLIPPLAPLPSLLDHAPPSTCH
jgi:hypothetical protein